jgi:hypothetical protein
MVYSWIMDTFIAPNGCEVAKVVTENGVTVYVDTSIPKDAMKAFHAKMKRRLISLLDPSIPEENAELERLRQED